MFVQLAGPKNWAYVTVKTHPTNFKSLNILICTRKCDGKQPACSQCSLRGYHCPGYGNKWIFRPPLTSNPEHGSSVATATDRRIGRRRRNNRGSIAMSSHACPLLHPLSWPIRDVISFCAQNFVPVAELTRFSTDLSISEPRICGSWIELLPTLLSIRKTEWLLSLAIQALGTSIVARGHDGRAPIPDALKIQGAALRALREAVSHADSSSFNGLAAATMCLFLSEVVASMNPNHFFLN